MIVYKVLCRNYSGRFYSFVASYVNYPEKKALIKEYVLNQKTESDFKYLPLYAFETFEQAYEYKDHDSKLCIAKGEGEKSLDKYVFCKFCSIAYLEKGDPLINDKNPDDQELFDYLQNSYQFKTEEPSPKMAEGSVFLKNFTPLQIIE